MAKQLEQGRNRRKLNLQTRSQQRKSSLGLESLEVREVPSTAQFLQVDNATQGSWLGKYGADGEAVVGTTAAYPSYAQVSLTNQSSWTWANPTSDTRALTVPGSTTRTASTWYGQSFTLDVNVGATARQVSLYTLDWDNAGRTEKITVLDADNNNQVLDTRTVSGFTSGKYVSFNVSGHVRFQVTSLSGPNAVVSGLFFDAAKPASASAPAAVAYTGENTTTQGNWQGVFGRNGYSALSVATSTPSSVRLDVVGESSWTWAGQTTDTRGLVVPGTYNRAAATWYGSSFDIDVNVGATPQQVSLYVLDWDRRDRSEKITAYNADTNQVLDTRTVSNFAGGKYVSFNVTGHVRFHIDSLNGPNAVVSGVFFDPAGTAVVSPPTTPPVVPPVVVPPVTVSPPTVVPPVVVPPVVVPPVVVPPVATTAAASFLGYDGVTSGTWQGVYGREGTNVIGTNATYPSYATLSNNAAGSHVWATSTTDTRDLTLPNGAGRIAGTWYGSTYSINVNLTDGHSHQVAFYFLDWDNQGRTEKVEVFDAASGTLLNSQSASRFGNGLYMVYNLSGNVRIQLTDQVNVNAVLSGIFFDPVNSPTPVLSPTVPMESITSDWITTATDRIPNFGGHPTLTAVQSGAWSNPATWGGRVPADNEVVSIPSNVTVTYDQVSDVRIDTVAVQAGGTLQFRTDTNTRLRVTNFLVMPNATLTIGTQSNPVAPSVKAEVIFNNLPIDTTRDPGQYGHGLIAFGRVYMAGATQSDTWLALASEIHAGDTTLTLSEPVSGWRAGDTLILPDTRQLITNPGDNFVSQTERRTIASISADGRTVTLTSAAQFDHLGARNPDGVLEILPKIGNQTRNVVVKSESATGVRGYTMFMDRADVDIRYSQFSGLGRTKVDELDSTTYDAAGNPTHIGANQTGRYAVNFSHLVGPAVTPADGYQFTFTGNSVFCPVTPMPFRWGINISDSSYGLVNENVVDNWAGAGIVAGETGNEIGSLIDHNFVTRGLDFPNQTIGRTTEFGYAGYGIYAHTALNRITNNFVGDSRYAYDIDLQGGINNVKVPLYPGADTRAGQFRIIDMQYTKLLEFSGNEAGGGRMEQGIGVYKLASGGFIGSTHPDTQESVILNMKIWHVFGQAFYNYMSDHLTFDGLIARGDTTLMQAGHGGATAFYFSDYLADNFIIRNSNVQGFGYGLDTTFGASVEVVNTYMRNWIDVHLNPQWCTGDARDLTSAVARTVTLRNVTYDTLNFAGLGEWGPQAFLYMDGTPRSHSNLILSDVVRIYDFDGHVGENYQVYYREQAANAILPQSIVRPDGAVDLLSAPQAGLTNAQAWAQYGIAFAGAVAPTNTTTREGIIGLVRPI